MAQDSDGPVLNAADLVSSTWMKLSAYFERRLASHRASNDADQTIEPTAKLRGRIAELKHLLALADPAPAIEPGRDED